MKRLLVSFLLAVLSACDLPTEPPPAKIPRAPGETSPVVIVGRVVNGTVGLQAANVRVTEAGVSAGTDETGHYRIVLPARFRGQSVTVQFRRIGYNVATRMVAITRNSVIVDLVMSENMLQVGCTMGILDTAVRR